MGKQKNMKTKNTFFQIGIVKIEKKYIYLSFIIGIIIGLSIALKEDNYKGLSVLAIIPIVASVFVILFKKKTK